MIIKKRNKPLVLQILESLNVRTILSSSEQKYYFNQLKGYEGEVQFDTYLEKLSFDCLVLNDLRLKESGNMVQIDSLILTNDVIYLYEVKNYSGNYDYKDDALHSHSDFVITNPLTQIYRSQPFIHNLVRKLGETMMIKSQIIFINPDFYLYDLPRDKSFLFVNQLAREFDSLEKKHSAIKESDKRLARQLSQLHIADYRPLDLPKYNYASLKKGVICPLCFSFEHIDTRKNRICSCCGYKETIVEAIKRSAENFHLLFPEVPITKHLIYEWCDKIYDEQRIQRVLRHHYSAHGSYKSTYYEVNSPELIK